MLSGCGTIEPEAFLVTPYRTPPPPLPSPYETPTLLPLLPNLVLVQGTLTVVGESETMVRASMDAECNVSMDAHAPLGMPGLAGKLTVHQGKNDLIQGTALYYGEQG